MRSFPKFNGRMVVPYLTVVALSASLLACGGGGTQIVDGGITGSGITMGRITSFGSIYVNGIKFDVDNASFNRDGIASSGQSEFSIGEFIVINGSIDASGTTGVASSVQFTDALEGAVTTASTDGSTIEILGQSIKTDPLTVFYDFAALTDLTVGNIVEVSGVADATGVITATSIRLKSGSFVVGISENEVKGLVSNLNEASKTFSVGNITVEYGSASLEDFGAQNLANGQFVEAKSNTNLVGNNLIASVVELEDEYLSLGANTEAEIEGFVTNYTSAASFAVNGISVTTTSATSYKNGSAASIGLNVFLEVEGEVNASGVLVAEEISFEDADSGVELEGAIQSVDTVKNEVEIAGQVVVIDASTIMIDELRELSPFTINDLVVGDLVEVKGTALANGKILATKFEREEID
ncbi:MAG: Unknown protein [uncultured Thiotrichaceae bacterium]|uniref:DUF5666 domain-containing protein n=1 Tax=uncultured Thiotrichaceae bacterium TaxID=298394 RepID=A0A6S6TB75_9GAMM|nr:MAG: Unknown protein [uncultured Thiotrichaceae bacterium]